MCTVTYIPNEEHGFTLTQNRDVNPGRFAREIVSKKVAGVQIIYPQDTAAGGTWMAASERDLIFCVMNGAFMPHKMGGTYRMSRGILALKIYQYPSASDFFHEIDLHDIEPFTMIICEASRLFEFRWDNSEKHLLKLDPTQYHIWASSTLYDEEWQFKRQKWFSDWLEGKESLTESDILDFHLHAGDGDPENDLVMNRADHVCTVSITMILRRKKMIDIKLKSLVSENTLGTSIPLRN